MDINIIGACQTLGCGRDGVQYGPDSLRENNLLNKLSQQQNLSIIDTGNIYNDDQIICTPNSFTIAFYISMFFAFFASFNKINYNF